MTNNLAEAYVFEKDAPAPEIEITKGMIKAGMKAQDDLEDDPAEPWYPDGVDVALIYHAMETQRRKEQGE